MPRVQIETMLRFAPYKHNTRKPSHVRGHPIPHRFHPAAPSLPHTQPLSTFSSSHFIVPIPFRFSRRALSIYCGISPALIKKSSIRLIVKPILATLSSALHLHITNQPFSTRAVSSAYFCAQSSRA